MGFFKWFKSGTKAAEKVLDAGISGIDKLVFTKEERAEAIGKLTDSWIKLQEILQGESTIRSITRRVLAFAVFFTYIPMVVAAVIMYPFDPEYGKFIMDVAEGKFGWLVVSVAAFYFGPYMLSRMLAKK